MEERNKDLWDAQVRGILVETQEDRKVLIVMNDETVEELFGSRDE